MTALTATIANSSIPLAKIHYFAKDGPQHSPYSVNTILTNFREGKTLFGQGWFWGHMVPGKFHLFDMLW